MAAGIFKNRVTEKDIRIWLDRNGFFGRSAEISDLELHAIKRPGWRQVFRFTVKAKPNLDTDQTPVGSAEESAGDRTQESSRTVLYGIVLDDQRKRTEAEQTKVFAFATIAERDQLLEDMSVDMLTCSAGQNADLLVLLAVVLTFVVVALVLGSLAGN